MGGEDQLDREAVEGPLHLGGGHASGGQLLNRRGQRFPEGLRMTEPLPVAEHPHPLPVFGDVGQIEKYREGAGHDPSLRDVEARDFVGQQGLGLMHAEAAVAGQPADVGHQRRGFRAGLFHDHRIEFAIEQANIAPQKVVVDHGL